MAKQNANGNYSLRKHNCQYKIILAQAHTQTISKQIQ